MDDLAVGDRELAATRPVIASDAPAADGAELERAPSIGDGTPGADQTQAQSELDAAALWEEKVRSGLRREIEQRENEVWVELTREREAEARAAAARAMRRARDARRSPYSPLSDPAQRDAARERAGENVSIELEGTASVLEGIGDTSGALEAAERLAELAPAGPEAWARVVRLRGEHASAADPPAEERASIVAPEARRVSTTPTLPPATSAVPESQWVAFVQSPMFRQQLGIGLAVLAILALIARVTRRRGDLAVHIVYPTEMRGTFRVRIDKRRGRWKRARPRADSEILKGGTSGTHEHFLVARETQFRRLPCRRYYLTVEGVLQDPRNNAVIEHPCIQTTVEVLHRRTVRTDVDATPGACPVDVRVTWDGKPVRDALVSPRVEGRAPLDASGGRVRLRLPKGHHTIAAGSGDRVAEYPLHVRSHLPTEVEVDLARNESIVFKACPPAVEPYLSGRFEAAADALTRDGQAASAHRLLARRCRERGLDAEAALHFEAADELVQAAELHATLGNYAHSGELFERAGDMLSAAEMYQLAGQEVRAGRAFEAAREFEQAIDCYRSAGAVANWVEALERRGETFEAARIALDNSLPTRGIRLLQRVVPDDPHYRDACVLLADAFERERHFDLAARKIEDYVGVSKPDEVAATMHWRLAELHEKAGNLERALDVLEDLRLLDPAYPNLATRAEQLRKARSAKRYAEARLLDSDPVMTPTVLLADQRYEILGEIGRGGMGVVFRARDRRLGRVIALKRLSENLREHPRAVQLFLREAQAAASLNHPNIVTVYDADQEDGTLFITMELLDGLPLNQVLLREGPLSSAEIVRVGRDVCSALAYAHARRVIHRDVKTANLFRTEAGIVKIMDFGLAKVLEEVRRSASVIGGTPYYMAPEQTLGGEVDHRADLYALGVTLFELATGRVPFPDGDAAYHNRHTAPPDPRNLRPDLEPGLAMLVLDLLAKDPDRRPQSAQVARARLDTALPKPHPPSSERPSG